MKVFRFMSDEEFEKYLNGETLHNDTNHRQEKRSTDSIGFCFMDTEDVAPEFAYEFLSGIVSDDVCVQFEVDESLLTESYGTYADPYGEDFFSTMNVTEYCCNSYNKEDFKMLSYCKDFEMFNFDWKAANT